MATLKVSAVIASALAYASCFPNLEWSWLMPVALALLFWALRDLSPTVALLAGFAHGCIAYGLCASWFWHLFNVMALALFGILAAFHALFAVLAALLQRLPGSASGSVRHAFLAAAVWTLVEFTRGELFWLKFPWFGVGVARGPHWLLPWLGVYGVTFLAVLAVLLLLSKGRSRLMGLIALLLWAFPGISPPVSPTATLPVSAIQAETAPLRTYLKLSEQAQPEARVLVWPEFAYSSDLTRNQRDLEEIRRFLSERPGTVLVLGTHTWVGEEGWHNTALTLDAQELLGRHFKNHTVHLFDDGIPGAEAKPVPTPHGRIGTPVCFDCDFQDVVRRMTAAGAEFIVAPTMDAESWTARQHEQHARLFQIRAAENRRWIVVAASSGVTQFIDPHGRVTARLPLMTEGVLDGLVERGVESTFFVQGGYLFPWVLLLAVLLTALAHWGRRRVGAGYPGKGRVSLNP